MFYFIHINKTAGTSIESALGLPPEHLTACEKIAQVGPEAWAQAFTFAVVRNPWDRVVSHYHFRVATNQTGLGDRHLSFTEWVSVCFRDQDPRYLDKPKMFMPQIEWVSDGNGLVLVDFIARFECLREDLGVVASTIGRDIELEHFYKTARSHYRDYFDDTARLVVAEWFSRDVEAFGYSF
jgi:hypothetical protein